MELQDDETIFDRITSIFSNDWPEISSEARRESTMTANNLNEFSQSSDPDLSENTVYEQAAVNQIEEQFYCHKCGMSFESNFDLLKHHCNPSNHFICDTPTAEFNDTKEFTPERYKCKVCKNILPSKQDLKIHMCTQQEVKHVQNISISSGARRESTMTATNLDDCSQSAEPNLSENNVYEQAAANQSDEQVYCHKCRISFVSRFHLLKHHCNPSKHLSCDTPTAEFSDTKESTSAPPSKERYECKMCKKFLSSNQDLKIHKCSQQKIKLFQCKKCSKAYQKKSYLTRHEISHTGIRQFKCEECNKEFYLRVLLNQHIRIHSGEKPFICTVCDKKFSRKSHLKDHKLTHTGEKPFRCTVCDKKFSLKQHLKRHMLTHTREKPFHCKDC